MRIQWFLMVGLAIIVTLCAFVWSKGLKKIPLTDVLVLAASSKMDIVSGQERQSELVTVLFGGDLMFDRWIRTMAQKKGRDFILAPMRATLTSADFVVANLEGPITDKSSVSETSLEGAPDNYVFTFPPETADFLRQENIELVNIGNNHILNFKEAGVEQTKSFLEKAHVKFFGSPLEGDIRYVVRDVRGTKIAFVNYNQFVWNGREKALADIAQAKAQADFLVLYAHWGKEYVPVLPAVQALAHAFVDAGADIIIGSHPHIVQSREDYKGKMIYYSLGNFVFDQYFRPETQAGLLVRATFDTTHKKVTTEDIPIQLNRSGQTEPSER